MVAAGRLGEPVPPTGSPILPLTFALSGAQPLTGVHARVRSRHRLEPDLHGPAHLDRRAAACRGQNELFFAPAGERPETRSVREAKARAVCTTCAVLTPCRQWARENREYGFWGGESEEERAAAGYRVDMPVGRVARYPKGDGTPVAPRAPRVA